MNSSRILYEDHKSFEHILNSLMEKNRYKKLAVSFDIDDTLIYSDTNTLIYPIYNFYTLCVKKGIAVFLITARQKTSTNYHYTVEQLKSLNIYGYKRLYLMPLHYNLNSYKYKEDTRKKITDEGYTIILSIGDQLCDIGKYGGKGILIS